MNPTSAPHEVPIGVLGQTCVRAGCTMARRIPRQAGSLAELGARVQRFGASFNGRLLIPCVDPRGSPSPEVVSETSGGLMEPFYFVVHVGAGTRNQDHNTLEQPGVDPARSITRFEGSARPQWQCMI